MMTTLLVYYFWGPPCIYRGIDRPGEKRLKYLTQTSYSCSLQSRSREIRVDGSDLFITRFTSVLTMSRTRPLTSHSCSRTRLFISKHQNRTSTLPTEAPTTLMPCRRSCISSSTRLRSSSVQSLSRRPISLTMLFSCSVSGARTRAVARITTGSETKAE